MLGSSCVSLTPRKKLAAKVDDQLFVMQRSLARVKNPEKKV
jgi:hypothetical protein